MSFLPIVERELRVAARRASTYRARWWVVLIALLIAAIAMGLVSVSGSRARLGSEVFRILTGYTFGLCLLAGVFLTADSLSQ